LELGIAQLVSGLLDQGFGLGYGLLFRFYNQFDDPDT
jgi:hypothetical protein